MGGHVARMRKTKNVKGRDHSEDFVVEGNITEWMLGK
jgi:hypothetical protein